MPTGHRLAVASLEMFDRSAGVPAPPPQPPTWQQMEEDLAGADPSDVVFADMTALADCELADASNLNCFFFT